MQVLRILGVRTDVIVSHVDTALRGRRVDEVRLSRRIVVGVRQLGGQLWEVTRALKSRPDVLHLTTSGHLGLVRDVCVLLACRLRRVPAVYHLHFGRVPELAARRSLEWWLLVRCTRLATAVVALDKSTQAAVSIVAVDTIVKRIPNPIDANAARDAVAFQGDKSDHADQYVLFLGWVVPAKGAEDLIVAWEEAGPLGWKLLIAGPVVPEYAARLRAMGERKCVTILGEVTHGEALALISKCAIFCLPSHSEGFPNVILEAMALGRPIVASRVGGIPEMLRGGCGELVEPRDIEGLGMSLRRLTDRHELRVRLGQRARARVDQEYGIDIVVQAYVDLWRGCAESA